VLTEIKKIPSAQRRWHPDETPKYWWVSDDAAGGLSERLEYADYRVTGYIPEERPQRREPASEDKPQKIKLKTHSYLNPEGRFDPEEACTCREGRQMGWARQLFQAVGTGHKREVFAAVEKLLLEDKKPALLNELRDAYKWPIGE